MRPSNDIPQAERHVDPAVEALRQNVDPMVSAITAHGASRLTQDHNLAHAPFDGWREHRSDL